MYIIYVTHIYMNMYIPYIPSIHEHIQNIREHQNEREDVFPFIFKTKSNGEGGVMGKGVFLLPMFK